MNIKSPTYISRTARFILLFVMPVTQIGSMPVTQIGSMPVTQTGSMPVTQIDLMPVTQIGNLLGVGIGNPGHKALCISQPCRSVAHTEHVHFTFEQHRHAALRCKPDIL